MGNCVKQKQKTESHIIIPHTIIGSLLIILCTLYPAPNFFEKNVYTVYMYVQYVTNNLSTSINLCNFYESTSK